MGKWCKRCGKIMKNQEATHCSDECLLEDMKKSKSARDDGNGVESWKETSDPWD